LLTEITSPTISVIIPTLNEARNLAHVLSRVPADAEVVVVDGRSTDGTVDVALSLRPDAVIVHQTRRGKGNALACGFAAARGDIIVMLDADGSADPGEIDAFVSALRLGADFAKGSRFCAGGGSSDITQLRRLGNRFLNGLVNILIGSRFTDLCYGYNAFWRHCLPVLELSPGERNFERCWGDGFEVETLINMRVALAGLRMVEVASYEHHRIHGISNLNAVSDGLRVLRTIMGETRRRGQIRPQKVTRPHPLLTVPEPDKQPTVADAMAGGRTTEDTKAPGATAVVIGGPITQIRMESA
jgi:glycosyltransferase involved in cell wall biosynthesis